MSTVDIIAMVLIIINSVVIIVHSAIIVQLVVKLEDGKK